MIVSSCSARKDCTLVRFSLEFSFYVSIKMYIKTIESLPLRSVSINIRPVKLFYEVSLLFILISVSIMTNSVAILHRIDISFRIGVLKMGVSVAELDSIITNTK